MSHPTVYNGLTEGRHTAQHWKFVCPFHDDHNPSLTVNKTGQYAGHFRCWACGEKGSPKTFARKMGLKVTHDFPRLDQYHQRKPKTLSPQTLARQLYVYRNHPNSRVFLRLSETLGIHNAVLDKFHTGFTGTAYSFPMFGADDELIGIRLRTLDGLKYSVTGGRNGLFVPTSVFNPRYPLIITEGESDCMAAYQMGFQAIGRPGNMQCIPMTADWMGEHGFTKAVLISDNDKPGREGTKALANYLVFERGMEAKIIAPPKQFKDFRQWFNAGAKRNDVFDLIDDAGFHIGHQISKYWNKMIVKIKGGKHEY